MAFDHLWDDTTPPDTQAANLLGQDIRNLKDDIAQRMGALSGLDAAKPNLENAFAGYLFFATDTGKVYQLQASDATPTHIGTWTKIGVFGAAGGGGAPSIVASLDLDGQTAPIAPVLLSGYIAPASALYRLSMSIQITTPQTGTTGSSVSLLYYTNNGTIQPPNGVSADSQVQDAEADGVFCLFIEAGSNLTYETVFNRMSAAPTYSIRLRLELLG